MRVMQAFVVFSGKSVFRNITNIVCAQSRKVTYTVRDGNCQQNRVEVNKNKYTVLEKKRREMKRSLQVNT